MIIDHRIPPEILMVGDRVNAAGVLTGADYMVLRTCGHTLELSHDDVRKGRVTAADYWEAITKLEGRYPDAGASQDHHHPEHRR